MTSTFLYTILTEEVIANPINISHVDFNFQEMKNIKLFLLMKSTKIL